MDLVAILLPSHFHQTPLPRSERNPWPARRRYHEEFAYPNGMIEHLPVGSEPKLLHSQRTSGCENDNFFQQFTNGRKNQKKKWATRSGSWPKSRTLPHLSILTGQTLSHGTAAFPPIQKIIHLTVHVTPQFRCWCKLMNLSLGVSKNRGAFTPQIIHLFIGFSIIFTIHFGGFTTPIFGNTLFSKEIGLPKGSWLHGILLLGKKTPRLRLLPRVRLRRSKNRVSNSSPSGGIGNA